MDDSMFVGDSTAYSRRSFLKGVGATAGFTLLAVLDKSGFTGSMHLNRF